MPTLFSGPGAKVVAVAALFIVVAGLRFGQAFFVPLALSVLVSLILSPLVGLLRRARVPRPVAVVGVVVLSFGLLALIAVFLIGQATSLGRELPRYRENVAAKLESVRGPFANALRSAQSAIERVRKAGDSPAPAAPSGQEPVKVEVVQAPDPLRLASAVLGPLVTLGGSFAVVFLLVIFFLLYQNEIRDRLIRLAGGAEVNATTATLDEATHGVSRFLFLQAVVNASYGLTLGLGLFAFGVPNALLWGFLAAVLRFIPYVGPIVGGVLPALISLAIFPGWTRPLFVAGFIVVLELVSNNLVEPVVYGKRTGLSPLAVVLAAVFWAWMWGGMGLLLAVPLTVCLVSLGRHVPSLRFLSVILSDEPSLEPEVRVYQRLLSEHQEEAAELLEKQILSGTSLAAVADESLMGVLRMTQADVHRGKLDPDKAERVYEGVREIIDDLAETARTEREKTEPTTPGPEPCATTLCLPASDPEDALAAYALAQALTLKGCRAKALPPEKTAGEMVEAAVAEKAEVLVICVSPASNLLRARYLYKRLRRRFGELPIIEAVWGATDPKALESRVAPDGRAVLVSGLREAEAVVERVSREVAVRKTLREGAA
jgi:predicted PurR-regulated permease PerM/methylmalonyl-CoA mutase cobalamin-binding subunit